MTKHLCLVIAIVLRPCFLQMAQTLPVKGICETNGDWRLVWSDEFDGDALNTSNWTPQDKASPRNHEKEDYDPANVLVRDGNLVLVTKLQERDHMNYTSGLVDSRGKAFFQYGRMCIRAKLPPGRDGIWPAHWMMPNDHACWPDQGELDIMEMINGDGVLHGTLHFNPDYPKKNCTWHDKSCGFQKKNISLNEYHEFAVEWTSTSMTFYVDGEPYGQCLKSSTVHIPDVPMYFILNTAIGGNWPKPPDNTTILPEEHLIDYVRVFQQTHSPQLSSASGRVEQPPNYYSKALSHGLTPTCGRTPNQSVLDPPGWYRNGGDFRAVHLDNDDDVMKCIELCCSEPSCIAFSFNKPQPFMIPSCPKGSVCCMLKDVLVDTQQSPYGAAVQTGTILPWKMLPGPTPPFPQSTLITAVKFGKQIFSGPSGDTWPFAWAADNEMYGSAGDNNKSKMNVWKASGFPNQNLDVELLNNYPLNLASLCADTRNAKPSSLLAVDDVLFMGVSCMNYGDNPEFNRQHNLHGFIAVSKDFGKTWSVPENTRSFFDGQFAAPEFVQFGQGNRFAPDDNYQVYAFFPSAVDGQSYWDNNDVIYVGRSHSGKTILDPGSWEFFAGYSSRRLNATWSADPTKAVPVISYHGMLGENGVSYNPYLKRYIMANYGFIDLITGLPRPWHETRNCSVSCRFHRTQFLLLEAEQPWGPWSLFYCDNDWDSDFPIGHRGHYTPTFPAKWILGPNNMWMVYSGNPHNYTLLAKEVELVTPR